MNPEQNVLTGPLVNVQRHPKTAVADLETALNILEKHADKISPLKVSEVYTSVHRNCELSRHVTVTSTSS